jgi:hypothetical protein
MQNRWGDYGGAALDPTNQNQALVVHERVIAPGHWGTWIALVSKGLADYYGLTGPAMAAGSIASEPTLPRGIGTDTVTVEPDPGEIVLGSTLLRVSPSDTVTVDVGGPVFTVPLASTGAPVLVSGPGAAPPQGSNAGAFLHYPAILL